MSDPISERELGEIRARAETLILNAISGTPDQYGRELSNFTENGESGPPVPELIAKAAAEAIIPALLAEIDRLRELMKEAPAL